jgi:hypothetical protein
LGNRGANKLSDRGLSAAIAAPNCEGVIRHGDAWSRFRFDGIETLLQVFVLTRVSIRKQVTAFRNALWMRACANPP